MTGEQYSMPVGVSVNVNVTDDCERTCKGVIEDRINGLVNQVAHTYAANRNEMPEMMGMETTVSIKAAANCSGGRRKLFGGFKCALEASCSLQADSRSPGYVEPDPPAPER